jgi:anti-anti-sigma regulatory factor
MNKPSAKLLVLVGKEFACVKIIGRANFTSSIDFKTLVSELRQKGYRYFVLDLSECVLMDSTFLGVLAGFGLKMRGPSPGQENGTIELSNPNGRITELLENLGVLPLFKLSQGPLVVPEGAEARTHTPADPTREEMTRACLEAHRTLMELNPENVARFKDVTHFMAEDLKMLKAGERSPAV